MTENNNTTSRAYATLVISAAGTFVTKAGGI
jgi:hypothetical protein